VNKGKTTNNAEKSIIGAESLSKVFGRGAQTALEMRRSGRSKAEVEKETGLSSGSLTRASRFTRVRSSWSSDSLGAGSPGDEMIIAGKRQKEERCAKARG
jgi:hypothetical protein